MGLGGVDKILVVQLSVCQFWQKTGRTGKLAERPVESCLRPLDPYTNGKLSARRLRRLFTWEGALLQPELWGIHPKIAISGQKATIFIRDNDILFNQVCIHPSVCRVAHNCAHRVQSDARGGALMLCLTQTLVVSRLSFP